MPGRALRAFVLSLLAVAAFAAHAQDSVFIEELTSTELQALVRAGKTTALVPIGGTEQNGPHMALGKHNVRVKVLAEKIARGARQRAGRAGDRLCARRQRRSADGAHALRRHDHGARRRRSKACSNTRRAAFARSGFRDIVFIGDHGGYQQSEEAVAAAAQPRVGGARRRACTRSTSTTAPPRRDYRAGAEGARLHRRRDRHARGPRRHVARARRRPAPRARGTSSRRQPALDAAHGVHGDPRRASAAARRSSASTLIVRASVDAIRRAIARR